MCLCEQITEALRKRVAADNGDKRVFSYVEEGTFKGVRQKLQIMLYEIYCFLTTS